MKTKLLLLLTSIFTLASYAQVVITNPNFSLGTTGRIGVGLSPNGEGNMETFEPFRSRFLGR